MHNVKSHAQQSLSALRLSLSVLHLLRSFHLSCILSSMSAWSQLDMLAALPITINTPEPMFQIWTPVQLIC